MEESSPAFAAAVRQRFDAHRHKVLATLRSDGSPRASGIEASFTEGELWLGMMPGSRKLADVRRDPRMAVHSGSDDPPADDPGAWSGDAKVTGRAIEITDAALLEAVGAAGGSGQEAPPGGHYFRIDITEVVLTRVGDPPDHLAIELWREGQPLRRMERR